MSWLKKPVVRPKDFFGMIEALSFLLWAQSGDIDSDFLTNEYAHGLNLAIRYVNKYRAYIPRGNHKIRMDLLVLLKEIRKKRRYEGRKDIEA